MRRPPALLGALIVLGALGGCASTPSDAPGAPTTDASPEPASPSPPSTPLPNPSPDDGETTPDPEAMVPADLTIALDVTGSGEARTFTLTCDPAGGDHPDPAEACAALAAAGGSEAFAAPPRDQVCTEIYGGPQVATVEGTVDGQQVSARFTRTNGCEISRWDVLAPLLLGGDGLL